jgi:hypothetical protein
MAALAVIGLYFRFWLPGIMSMCLVLGCLATDARLARRWVGWSASVLLIGGLVVLLRTDLGRIDLVLDDLPVALGRRSLDERYRNDPLWNAWDYLNTNTSTDSRILAAAFYTTFGVSSGGLFWVDRASYVTDSHTEGFFHFDDWSSFLESVREARINYVVIYDEQYEANRLGFTFEALKNEYPFCRRLVEEHGELVYKSDHLGIYRLRDLSTAISYANLRAPSQPTFDRRPQRDLHLPVDHERERDRDEQVEHEEGARARQVRALERDGQLAQPEPGHELERVEAITRVTQTHEDRAPEHPG